MVRLQFGSWLSPLSASRIAEGSVRLSGLQWRDDAIWWSESRPKEKGRTVVLRQTPNEESTTELAPGFSVRSAVHEYGGGAWWLGADSEYFVNWEDQRIYRRTRSEAGPGQIEPITPESTPARSHRFADGREHPSKSVVVAVFERHIEPETPNLGNEPPAGKVQNQLVLVDVDRPGPPRSPRTAASGADFYAAPRFSPDGRFLSWIEWNHPQMPWEGAELYIAELQVDADGLVEVGEPRKVAGGDATSIVGPNWTREGSLVFSTDKTGFWNLHEHHPETSTTTALTALTDREIGGPAWVLGLQPWTQMASGDLAVVITADAADSLAVVSMPNESGKPVPPKPIETSFCQVDEIVAGPGDTIWLTGSSSDGLPAISELTTDKEAPSVRTLHRPGGEPLAADCISRPRPLTFPSGDGQAHAFFYPPAGADGTDQLEGLEDELPPLLVMSHGGPTGHNAPVLSLKVQYWTSRGFAVVDVNYRGSSGFGRDYRRLLNGRWGVVDVEDCVAAAEYVIAEGLADANRVAIRGGSAGGFTVLRALQTSRIFSAGTTLYGVADLEALALDTHKFESRYLDGLLGPYPQARDLYVERSPITHTDDLACPLLVMQGTEDKVVPPSQSEAIVAAVADKRLPHIYLAFEGEQHGFRQAETIVRSLEVELWFYGQLFGFDLANEVARPSEAVNFL